MAFLSGLASADPHPGRICGPFSSHPEANTISHARFFDHQIGMEAALGEEIPPTTTGVALRSTEKNGC
jgi:hypothetical protein